MNTFTFNGTSCGSYGVTIANKNVYASPARDVESIVIPGRSGDLLIDNKRFENINITYKCYIIPVAGYTTLSAQVRAFKSWLLADFGYKKLSDTYNTDYFRYAAFSEVLNIEEVFEQVGKVDITFNCKPFLYSDAGLTLITMTGAGAYQEEEITFTGSYVRSGSVHFSVTAACMAPTTTRSFYFSVDNITAIQLATVIKTSIDDNNGTANNIRDFFTVTRNGAKLTFTAKTKANNDSTMNMAISNDDGANYTGFNDIPASTAVTAGELPNSGIIVNPELFPSYPYIKITGSGNVTLSIGSSSFVLTAIGPSIEIDSEIMNVYRGATSLNSKMTSSGFPVLLPGDNSISWTGTVTKVEIIPRWCTL